MQAKDVKVGSEYRSNRYGRVRIFDAPGPWPNGKEVFFILKLDGADRCRDVLDVDAEDLSPIS